MAVQRQNFIFKIALSLLLSGFLSVPEARCNRATATNQKGSQAKENQSKMSVMSQDVEFSRGCCGGSEPVCVPGDERPRLHRG